MADDTTLTIRLEEAGSPGSAGGPTHSPAPVPPPQDRYAAAIPAPTAGGLTDSRASREADRLGLLLGDVAARVNRGLLTLAEGLDRADRLGRGDAGLDYARDRGFDTWSALAGEVLNKAAAKTPAVPQQPAFDFTPAGGVPFDVSPRAASPGTPPKPAEHTPFDFSPPKPVRIAEAAPPQVAERIEPPAPTPPAVAEWLAKAGQHLPGPLGRVTGFLPDVARGFGRPAELPTAPYAVGPAPTGKAAVTAEAAGGAKVVEGGAAAEFAGGSLATGLAAAGVALAVVAATAHVLKVGFEETRQATRFFGDQARAVAGNDGIGLLSNAADAAAGVLGKIPVAGGMLAAEVQALAEPFRQLDATARAFVARGRELAQYDARLAVAAAEADIRKLDADLREASRTGESLGRLTDSQSRLDVSIQDALTPLKVATADGLANLLDKLTAIVEIQAPLIETGVERIQGIIDLIATLLEMLPGYKEYMKRLNELVDAKKEIRRLNEERFGSNTTRNFVAVAEAMAMGRRQDNAAPGIIQQQMAQAAGLPLLYGSRGWGG